MTIENRYDPDAAPSTGRGIGLRNVRHRLTTVFGAEGQMELRKNNGAFRVEITVPAIPGPNRAGEVL
jgi:sensor histidine kinase YesM